MRVKQLLVRMTLGLLSLVAFVVVVALGAAFVAMNTEWELPREIEVGQPSVLQDRDGVTWYRFVAEVDHSQVALEDISPNLRDAVIATEDHRFYVHNGVDPLSVIRAVWANLRENKVTQGASTLTQQYVKLTFTGDERTYRRKIREAVLAVQVEKDLSKDQILQRYLNRAYFGEGAYGAQAAAAIYFDVPASRLSLAQAATIASTLGRPADYSPVDDPAGTQARRDRVLQEMADYGFRTQQEVDSAKAEPLGLRPVQTPPHAGPYLVEEIRRQLLSQLGPDLLYRGGLTIRSTVDLHRQYLLELQMIPHLPAEPGFEPAAVALDPSSGDVIAAWSGRDFGASQVDLALGGDYGRPSGSTFKIFALAAALEEGFTLESRWAAPSQITIGDWSPRGGGCGGRCTLLQATANSVNTVFAQVANEVGVPSMVGMARRMGVESTLRDDDLTQVLGTSSVTPLDMASAIGTLANDGVACPARLVISVTDPAGVLLDPPDPRQPDPAAVEQWTRRITDQGWRTAPEILGRCHRAMAPGVARRANVALQAVVAGGTGRRAAIGRPQAGKTGTTSDSTQVWFAGYTPDLAMSIMVSHRDGDVPLRNLPGCGAACFGGQLPAQIWADIAPALLEGIEPHEFPLPQDGDREASEIPTPPPGRTVPVHNPVTGPVPATPSATYQPPPEPEPRATGSGGQSSEGDDSGSPGTQDDPPGPNGGIIGDLLGGGGGDEGGGDPPSGDGGGGGAGGGDGSAGGGDADGAGGGAVGTERPTPPQNPQI
ncbi:MAG: transglycosylase domain-containing protein [Euzebya sp.]